MAPNVIPGAYSYRAPDQGRRAAGKWRTKPELASFTSPAGKLDAGQPAPSPTAQEKPPEQPKPRTAHAPKRPQGPGKARQAVTHREGSTGEEPEVKGFMTLNEVVLKTGVPKAFILKELGLSEAGIDARAPLRDWVHAQGTSVPELRESVAKYRARRQR